VLRFYEIAIEPVLRAADARRVVEIGARKGGTTKRLLDLLGPEAELHVIDPVPQFDPSDHERRFPGRYHFHRDISHNVLPDLPPVDVALIDGDHNWYTVYNELRMLVATAREAAAPLPVLLLHDVAWPYGRRDLYYAPERIPEEFRQPYDRKGIAPRHPGLRAHGGLNRRLANALREGGERNGVRTALEDFVAADEATWRTLILPVHFGLGIAADSERLRERPELAKELDRLEGPEGRFRQAELAESVRVGVLVRSAGLAEAARRGEHAAQRYLDVVKAALLDEHYLENEVRLNYLQRCVRRGDKPDPLKLRDPRMWLTNDLKRLRQERRIGVPVRSIGDRPFYPYTTIGRTGLDHLQDCLETIHAEAVPGDFAACGVWRGGTAIFMRAFLDALQIEKRKVWVADNFRGPAEREESGKPKGRRTRFENLVADLNHVRRGFDRFGLFDERVRFLQGRYAATLPDAPIGELALLHLGDDDAERTTEALENLYDRLAPGGFVVIEHHDEPGCRRAVGEFRQRRGIEEPIHRADWTGASWRKADDGPVAVEAPAPPREQADRAPVPTPPTAPSCELSVVVVFYDMRREAERTLHSLSRTYQEEVDDLDYEVIVVENGSSKDERLGEEFVRGFGREFRYLDLGSDAKPSPAYALNRGIAIARGESLALMIDGAHVLTPGVLHYGMLGLRAYAPAIVTTYQFYLGPGQQGEAIDAGYDQEYEDRLFERIGWPQDGYRLFEIGNFIGDRDWFDGLWESNCLFTPRALLEQVGGLDESFSMPGGGYANLDLFERLAATPGVTVAGQLGEGSFHQLHGGTTTNQPDDAERHARLMSYRHHYEELRKRPFRGPGKPRHFVGKVGGAALRSRPRWMTPSAFRDADRARANGVPEKPTPVPEQLQAQYTDAFWRSLAWRDVNWLGTGLEKAPTDLVAYQELVAEVRPDWIVELGGSDGGALFFASLCDLVGSGNVLSVRESSEGQPEHPRITYVTGKPTDEETRRRVFETVGEGANALLVLGAAPAEQIVPEFKAYSALVGLGSYAIFEGTIVNGHPVLPGYGPGPAEALTTILKNRRDFAPDHRPERFGLTFNPRGFLKRVE
jgi:cephalosporin hydroxylase